MHMASFVLNLALETKLALVAFGAAVQAAPLPGAGSSQVKMLIKAFEGERAMTKDAKLRGKFHLDGLPPAPRAPWSGPGAI